MRASSAMTTRSAHSAMSLPPATAKPCTLPIVGRSERKRLKKLSVLRFIQRRSFIGSQTVACAPTPRLGVHFQVVAGAEGAAGAATTMT